MNKWTREETIIAFNAYCKIPFKSSRKTHPLVVRYARIIGRSPSALNMKIGNIGRLDPDLKSQGITGLKHGAKEEETVWEEFYGNPEHLAYESERQQAENEAQNAENLLVKGISLFSQSQFFLGNVKMLDIRIKQLAEKEKFVKGEFEKLAKQSESAFDNSLKLAKQIK